MPPSHFGVRDLGCTGSTFYSNQGGGPTGTIRDGDWKLIEWFETGRTVLYNLRFDVSESFDISSAHPKKVAELLERLSAWRMEAVAKMPVVNLWYDDIVAGRISRPDGTAVPPELAAL